MIDKNLLPKAIPEEITAISTATTTVASSEVFHEISEISASTPAPQAPESAQEQPHFPATLEEPQQQPAPPPSSHVDNPPSPEEQSSPQLPGELSDSVEKSSAEGQPTAVNAELTNLSLIHNDQEGARSINSEPNHPIEGTQTLTTDCSDSDAEMVMADTSKTSREDQNLQEWTARLQ